MSASVPLRRLARLVVVFLVVTLMTTFMLDLAGNPAVMIAGDNASPEAIAAVEERYGFDDPPLVRYVDWISGIFHGDFGSSYRTGQPVTEILQQRLPVTVELMIAAMILTLLVSIPLALLTASRAGGRIDKVVIGVGSAVSSIPIFLTALILVYIFAVRLGWFPVTGWVALTDDPLGNLQAVFLPALSLALFELVVFQRVLRSDLIQTMNEDFIASAQARGIPRRRVMMRHALRSSSFSTITLAGLSMARLLGGSILIEQVFSLPGLGNAFYAAVSTRDLVVVQGLVTFVAVAYLLMNLLVDLSYPIIDPRVRTRT